MKNTTKLEARALLYGAKEEMKMSLVNSEELLNHIYEKYDLEGENLSFYKYLSARLLLKKYTIGKSNKISDLEGSYNYLTDIKGFTPEKLPMSIKTRVYYTVGYVCLLLGSLKNKQTLINKAEKIIDGALKYEGNESFRWLKEQLIIVKNGGQVYIK